MQRKLIIPLVIVGIIFSFGAFTVTAQSKAGQPVVLNDGVPSADVVITPTGGAQGVVYLQMDGVHAQFLDSTQSEFLSLTDARVRGLAIQMPQGASSETLHLERLPGVSAAQALITAQAAMPTVGAVPMVDTAQTTSVEMKGSTTPPLLKEPSSVRVVAAPTSGLSFATTDTVNMLSALFPAQGAIIQLTDSSGTVLLTLVTGSQINGLAVQLAPGAYALNLTNLDLSATSETVFTLSAGPASALKPLPQTAALNDAGAPAQQPAPNGTGCTAAVAIPTANVRSGPGTAYRVLGAVARDGVFPVGGTNREGGWLLIQSPAGPAWISTSVITQSGTCADLRAFDLPLLNAVPVKPVIAQADPVVAPPVIAAAPPSNNGGGSHAGSGKTGDGNTPPPTAVGPTPGDPPGPGQPGGNQGGGHHPGGKKGDGGGKPPHKRR